MTVKLFLLTTLFDLSVAAQAQTPASLITGNAAPVPWLEGGVGLRF